MPFSFLNYWRQSRLSTYSDAVLCEECLAGNEEAWAVLLDRYQNLIYSIPLKFQFNSDEAAEIFQGVVLDLYAGLERLRDREKLDRWLIAVTRHRCLKYKERREIEPLAPVELREALESSAGREPAIEGWLLEVEEEKLLRESIHKLPARCQELVHMLFYSDPTPDYEALAAKLGVARNSIGFIRGRCLDKLRTLLEQEGFARNLPPAGKAHPAAGKGES